MMIQIKLERWVLKKWNEIIFGKFDEIFLRLDLCAIFCTFMGLFLQSCRHKISQTRAPRNSSSQKKSTRSCTLYARRRYMVCVCFWFCEFPSVALCVRATLKSHRKISWSATQRKRERNGIISSCQERKSATAQFAATCVVPFCLFSCLGVSYSLELLLSLSLQLFYSQSVWELCATLRER